jgi:16S rRNA (cytosine967-C5)-methyltransferase
MKWRLGPDDVAALREVQADVLDRAAKLVKPGGRLIYATCSLLAAENEGAVDAFVARRPEFRVLPVGDVWASVLAGPCPADGAYLRLTPARHNTDGFFAAILERIPAAQAAKAGAAQAAKAPAAQAAKAPAAQAAKAPAAQAAPEPPTAQKADAA